MAEEPDKSGARSSDSYAVDALGIRRFVRAGDRLWAGWKWADEPATTAEPVAAEKKPSPGSRKK